MSEARCPMCERPARDKPDPVFPFCSERCKNADLGRWLGGEYRIPVRQVEEDEDGIPPRPEGGLDS